jgi:hypothetical protein
MKTYNTPIYNKMIRLAIDKIRKEKIKPCSDGGMINIIYKRTRKGQWQVEYIHDTRFTPLPYLAAYFFRKNEVGYISTVADGVKFHYL